MALCWGLCLWLACAAAAQSNGVLREVWLNIGGSAVADLTNNAAFPSSPSFDEVATNGFEAPADVYETDGQRLRALLLPPTTGDYVFLIASDDASQLFLGTNNTPASKRLIARVDAWTGSRKYHLEAGQISSAVRLTAGQRYYIEALMKEGNGGDNLAVTWRKPGESEPGDDSPPIPNANLLPYAVGVPVFTVPPKNTAVTEGATASLSVQVERATGVSYQWFRSGTNIPGATSGTLLISPARLADNGVAFFCRASNSFGSTNSSTAILTVNSDVTRPTITSVQCCGDSTLVTVGFSELVEPVSARTAANYLLNNGVSVLSVTLLPDGSSVLLRTTSLTLGATYVLTVSNVRDLAQTPNSILPYTQRAFTFSYTPLPIAYVAGTNEPAGPSSRRTPLAISEVMFHPADRLDGKNLEFIELYNSNPWAENLSGYRLAGDVDFTFPPGTTIPALGYRVVAPKPADLQAVYGLAGVLGPLTNATAGNATNVLPNGGGTIRLRDELNTLLLSVTYSDQPPWPAAADGAGHSLVLARPSCGQADPRAWAASDRVGGSPGAYDAYTALASRAVRINEILAHTDPPQEDYIELYNYSSAAVNIGGCVLTDDPATNRFRIPAGTTLPSRGFLAFTQTALGFALNAAGETAYFLAPEGERVLDAVRFGDQENGVPWGRYPDGGPVFRRLARVTLGTNNAPAFSSDIVINEIHYHPASQDQNEEFVELYNRGSNAVALSEWRLSGGIAFTFPGNASLSAGGYVVVAKNLTNLLAVHPTLNPALVLGNYSGKLANSGDILRLDKPDAVISTNASGQLVTNQLHVVVEEVAFGTGGRWGRWADGGGSSLERVDPRGDSTLASNWADSDETGKSGWVTVESAGVLDLGAMAQADQLQLFVLGAGECLVDDVEVIPEGGTNLVSNGSFDSGSGGWFFQGTHEDSFWQSTGGASSAGCLHVVAADRGDTGANRIRTVLSQTLAEGATATLRARVRWLKGHPQILFRLHGNWLEAAGSILATRDLGSPGTRNSRCQTNAGPALTEVRHWPVLPAAVQAVTVIARIDDPDGIAQALLKYRIDPASNYVALAMSPCGAGFYSAVIPGQPAGTRAAFFIEACDAFALPAVSRFPNDAPTRECLVGFGDSSPVGAFATYRLLVSQRNVARWASREKQSNKPLDATFVYSDSRVCYNVGALYSGSPFHTPGYSSPDGNLCDYEVNFAPDDPVLGTRDFVLATIGNLNSDPTFQGEQTAFWICRSLGTPYLNRRYIRLFFNGQQRGDLYEDAQQPNGDVLSAFFPDDDEGNLHKIEDWFEFDNTGDAMLGNVDATLQEFTTTGGAKKTARYRWNWRPRATPELANAFTNLFTLVDAMNATQAEPYRSWVAGLVNVEEFMRVLATDRIVGNWDSYGYSRGKNMFIYKPTQSAWQLLPWDIDFVFSAGGNSVTDPLFGSNEPVLDRFRAFPEFQRAYWRAFEDAVNGPLQSATLTARVTPRYTALTAAGVGASSPEALLDYAAQRRDYILSQLDTVASPFAVNPSVTVSNGIGVLTGTAPISALAIWINGAPWTVQWITVTNWIATVPLQTGSNGFSVVAFNRSSQAIPGASNSVVLNYAAATPSPLGSVVVNEIMAQPSEPDAEYVELFNRSTNAFDLSGWALNGLDYTFPNGASIAPHGYLVLAKTRAAFSRAYGSAVAVFDEYPGNLQAKGETLSLLKPALPAGTFLVVDRVRYEAADPWPQTAPGMALQLQDPAQDNARVANWTIGSVSNLASRSIPLMAYTNVWRFLQTSNLDGINWTTSAFNHSAWPSGPGLLAYEVNDTIVPLIGTNLNPPALANDNVASGHAYYFRALLVITNDLTDLVIHASAYIDDGAVFYVNGREAMRVRIADGVVVSNLTFATSYPPGGDATVPDLFTLDNTLFTIGTNLIAVEVHQNQPQSSDIAFGLQLTADSPRYTNLQAIANPGIANSVRTILPAFPSLWLNEAQPDNLSGPLDNTGQREPWVELFNPGTNALNLGGYFLSDNYTNLGQWAFPSNVTVPAGGFTVVWCDGHSNQTAVGAPHAAFRLSPGAGQLALSRFSSNTVQLVDYLTYTNLQANWSYGDLPDAQPFYRGPMYQFTPGATNSAASPPLQVRINEWMADNAATLADPADHDFEDWFEIHNPGTNIADLGGYFLTDNLTNKFQFQVPNNGHYLIPAGSFLLVWADNEPSQNSTSRPDLHASFALSKNGEAIGIFAPDGTPVDVVTFGPQTNDVSQGRFPDGTSTIRFLTLPTPRAANRVPNTSPTLAPIGDQGVTLGQTLQLTPVASDSDWPQQLLLFSLGDDAPPGAMINSFTGFFSWCPPTAPATNSVTITVTDDGEPRLSASRTFQVTTYLPPTIEVRICSTLMRLSWPRGTLQEADVISGPYLDVTDRSPLSVDLSETQRFYRIRLPR